MKRLRGQRLTELGSYKPKSKSKMKNFLMIFHANTKSTAI